MMTKKIIQIIGIIMFFATIAYVLTYPYELAYEGTEDIKLIEESYEFTSLEQVIKRPEFKGKVLFVRVWEPLKGEVNNSYLKENYNLISNMNKVYKAENVRFYWGGSGISFKNQLEDLSEMQLDYSSENVVFVFLTRANSAFKNMEDDLRKWKAIIKKFEIKGYHFVMSPKLEEKLSTKIMEIKKHRIIFPHNFIVDRLGNIVNNNAKSPSFDKEILYSEIDSILKH